MKLQQDEDLLETRRQIIIIMSLFNPATRAAMREEFGSMVNNPFSATNTPSEVPTTKRRVQWRMFQRKRR
jgi:hypothetical protein